MTTKQLRSDQINSLHQWLTLVEEVAEEVYIPKVSVHGTVSVVGESAASSSVISAPIVVSLSGTSSVSQALPAGCTKLSAQAILSSSTGLYAWLIVNTTASDPPSPSSGGIVLANRGDDLIEGLDADEQYYLHVGLYSVTEVATSGSTYDKMVIQPWVKV